VELADNTLLICGRLPCVRYKLRGHKATALLYAPVDAKNAPAFLVSPLAEKKNFQYFFCFLNLMFIFARELISFAIDDYPQRYHRQDADSVLVERLRIIIYNFANKYS